MYVYLLLPDGGAFRPVPGARAARWWFENSRAYLYYFFIVNDCQFIVRSFASGREALKDGGVFVRCAFPYKAIVNFLVRVVFGSLHGFFYGGFDSGSG